MVENSGYCFPAFYALMTRKTGNLYSAVFRKICDLVPGFTPSSVMTDYEDALVNAVTSVFGHQVQVSGCFFHYNQAVVRKFRQMRFHDSIRTSDQIQHLLRCLLALPLLPVHEVVPGFVDVKNQIPGFDEAVQDGARRLCLYVDKQWIKKSTVGPERLSVFNLKSRTNNGIESYHSMLQRRIKSPHPNLYTFLGYLKNVTVDGLLDLSRLLSGLQIRRNKKKCYVLNDKRIQTVSDRLSRGEVNRLDFLRAVSYNIKHPVSVDGDDLSGSDDDSNEHEPVNDVSEEILPQNETVAINLENNDRDPVNACEVCLLQERCRKALVPCGHSRLCDSCLTEIMRINSPCPICRSVITMVLNVY